jgi:hypothetical protein
LLLVDVMLFHTGVVIPKGFALEKKRKKNN